MGNLTVAVDSGDVPLLRQFRPNHQPDRERVVAAWITLFADDVRRALRALPDIIEDIVQFRIWEKEGYKDPSAFLEFIGARDVDLSQAADLVRSLREHPATTVEEVKARSQALAALAKDTPPSPKHGEIGRGRGSKTKNATSIGRGAAYRIARLKRDHPDIGRRLEAGEFKNVREAERAAGLPVPPLKSPVEKLVAAFRRLTVAQRREFLAAVQAES